MAQRTKHSESDRITRRWLKWRVQGKLKVSPDEVQKLSMKTWRPGRRQGVSDPGWCGGGVSRGSASGRRCPHPVCVVCFTLTGREGSTFEMISTV
eukprot:2511169-Amphidinium_carterae.1